MENLGGIFCFPDFPFHGKTGPLCSDFDSSSAIGPAPGIHAGYGQLGKDGLRGFQKNPCLKLLAAFCREVSADKMNSPLKFRFHRLFSAFRFRLRDGHPGSFSPCLPEFHRKHPGQGMFKSRIGKRGCAEIRRGHLAQIEASEIPFSVAEKRDKRRDASVLPAVEKQNSPFPLCGASERSGADRSAPDVG